MKTHAPPSRLVAILFIIHFTLFIGAAARAQQSSLTISNQTYSNTTITESALNTLQTSGAVIVNPTANVTFEAGDKITLKSGFNAKSGSKFRARIGITAATPPLMCFDTISANIYNNQAVTGSGWAADPKDGAPVNRVEVWIDNINRGLATRGGDRPDVQNAYNRPDWRYSGFTFTIPTSNLNLALGQHTVQLKAYNNAGLSATADKTFRIWDLSAIDPATGLPIGMIQDSNHNGIPDYVEINLGLDPAKNNDAQLQNIKRDYQYDPNDRLITAPERAYQLDAEGNIKGN